MWFNSTLREKPYQGSKAEGIPRGNPRGVPSDRWCMVVVSSCREMLGQVPKRAQPLSPVAIGQRRELWGHCRRKPEEDGDDVKSARPLFPGPHTCYNGRHRGKRPGDRKRIPKAVPSSDWSLQPGSTKLESLVIADQHCCGECVLGFCTHCPSHHESLQRLKPLPQPQGGERQGRGR